MQLAFSHGTPYLPYKAGMGNLEPDQQQIAGIAAMAAVTTAKILVTLGTIGGPVGAAIAGVAALGIAIANAFAGCGQTCVAASNIANQIEAILQQNLQKYLGSPVRYKSLQLAALNNFDVAWAALYKACSNQALLQAGVNCIQDRQQGACKWRSTGGGQWVQDASGWTYQAFGPGTDDASGVCFNWFKAYRDPIANDPTVVPDPTPTDEISSWFGGGTSSGGGIFSGAGNGSSLMPALLIGGAAIAALMIVGDN